MEGSRLGEVCVDEIEGRVLRFGGAEGSKEERPENGR